MISKLRTFYHEINAFPNDYKLLWLMLFLVRMGQFMLMPFMAIFLYKNFAISPSYIGFIIGAGALSYGFSSLFAGVVVDRIGAKNTLHTSILLNALIIYFLFYFKLPWWCLTLTIVYGSIRACFDVATKVYKVNSLSREQRHFSFSIRYMIVNSAASLGPLCGIYFADQNSLRIFNWISFLYLGLGILSFYVFRVDNKSDSKTIAKTNREDRKIISIIKQDKQLQYLVILYLIFWTVFSQIESTLPQYLAQHKEQGIHIYSHLLFINAFLCVVLQLVLYELSKSLKESHTYRLAVYCSALTWGCFCLDYVTAFLYIGIVLLTLGEIILIPGFDRLLMKIAPVKRLGSYYGALGLGSLGLGLGPILGGIVYEYAGPTALFIFIGCLTLSMQYFFKLFFKNQTKPTE